MEYFKLSFTAVAAGACSSHQLGTPVGPSMGSDNDEPRQVLFVIGYWEPGNRSV